MQADQVPRQKDPFNCGLYTITNIDIFCTALDGEVTMQKPKGRSKSRAIFCTAADPFFIENPRSWCTLGDIGFLRILLSAGLTTMWADQSEHKEKPAKLDASQARNLLASYLKDRTPDKGELWCDSCASIRLLHA